MDIYGFIYLAIEMLRKCGKKKVKIWFEDFDGRYEVTIKRKK